jgi:lipopolysaccharide assembly protein A
VKILYRAVLLAVAVVVILFAVSNRQTVSVGLWPLPFLADIALYLLCFLSLLVGFVLGLWAGWAGGRGGRRELRNHRQRIEALERELAATQAQLDANSLSPRVPASADRQLN